jgi:hypothetical protein
MDRFVDMVADANGSPDDEEAAVTLELEYLADEQEEEEKDDIDDEEDGDAEAMAT